MLEMTSTLFLCNFGDRTMSGFEVIEGDLLGSPPVAASKKKNPVWIGLGWMINCRK